jgi:glycine amidinotransferase
MFPQEMVDAANEQMDNFVRILETRGIIVDRVEVHPIMLEPRAISTPDWTQLNMRGINCPRDLFLPVGNEIMEAPGTQRSRWYEYLNLRPIFERYFKEDPDFLWTAAPKPRLTDESFVKNYYYDFEHTWDAETKRKYMYDWRFQLTEKEPLWDAADAARCGKDIFWQASSVTNRSGMDWLKRYFGAKGIHIHPVMFDNQEYYHPWHIDVSLIAVRPGLVITNPVGPLMTEEAIQLFKKNDWQMVEAAPPTHFYKNTITVFGEEREGPDWISMNTLSLGPNTIAVEAHELKYIDQLTKLGFEVVEVPYEKVVPFGGSLHCTTLDVYREETCEDYFPKQIPGYG